jgi:hypothetical protein
MTGLAWSCAVAERAVGHLGGEHLQHFNVSGFQGKNLSTEQVCQAEAVNLSIAFGPRPNGPLPSLQQRKTMQVLSRYFHFCSGLQDVKCNANDKGLHCASVAACNEDGRELLFNQVIPLRVARSLRPLRTRHEKDTQAYQPA